MAQEDETSLHDELVDPLLPDPAQHLLRRYGARDHCHKYQVSVVLFGSTLLNIVLAVLLLRARSEHHERQKSLYG